MFKSPTSHLTAVLQALFITFLWSTSRVLIKLGLKDIPALTFAGRRYALAFVCSVRATRRAPVVAAPTTALVQVSLLAGLFLGEALTPRSMTGLALAGSGALIVQLRRAIR